MTDRAPLSAGDFNRIVAAAYASPLSDPIAVLRAFWPSAIAYGVWLFSVFSFGRSGFSVQLVDNPAAFFALILVVIYFALLSVRGAISWHRHVILGEAVPWTPLLPDGRTFRYLTWSIVVSLVGGLTIALIGVVVFSVLYGAIPASTVPSTPSIEIQVISAVVATAIYALAIVALARLAMGLPQTAVDAADSDWSAQVPVRKILLATAIPLALVGSLLPVFGGGVVVMVMGAALNAYALLVALTGLSLAFRFRHGTDMAA